MKKKVMVGMSGGVDSSVAALLLKKQGYDVFGVTLKLRKDEYMTKKIEGGCCSLEDIDDAKRVARKLEIPHYVFNFTDIFEKKVIDDFVREYANGKTPNPCIACNKYIKFGAMLLRARELDIDYIATGHYAKVEYDENRKRYLLKKSPAAKDQSYVLYGMTQDQLSRTIFPLCNISKDETRRIASQYGLPVAHKADSQEICFVDDNNYARFIEEYSGKESEPGNFVDKSGSVIGKHKGVIHYTIGQRKGLGMSFGKHMYVTGIDAENNTVVLGEEGSQYSDSLTAGNINWIAFDGLENEIEAEVKVRYQAPPAKAKLTPLESGKVKVEFENPQRSITPGQAAVFYDGDVVLGGGVIL